MDLRFFSSTAVAPAVASSLALRLSEGASLSAAASSDAASDASTLTQSEASASSLFLDESTAFGPSVDACSSSALIVLLDWSEGLSSVSAFSVASSEGRGSPSFQFIS